MKRIYLLLMLLIYVLSSCEKKNQSYYFEIQHRNGSKFIDGLIHSDLNCENINGSVRKIGLDHHVGKYFSYAGVCHKCMSEKGTEKFVSMIDKLMYQDRAEKGFDAVYNMARMYFSEVDSIPKKEFIETAMINVQSNIEKVYDYVDKSKLYDLRSKFKDKDIEDSRFLFDMDKSLFLIRIKRWAKDYLSGVFIVSSENLEEIYDRTDLDEEE